ncbi:AsmA-like C-terminal region-containing protein [Fluviicola taffensis]|nr:AsmA-like C-terminal region-containing protein [Fluviicola taffensis]
MYLIITPILLFSLVVAVVYWKQDALVQELLTTLNKDFKGEIKITDSHVSPFANFPHISIDLENLRIYEDKNDRKKPIIKIQDVYVGFDLWTIISGKTEMKSIKAKDGKIILTQHLDGSLNLLNALSSNKKAEEIEEELHLDLKSIVLDKIDIQKYNEANKVLIDLDIEKATSKFKMIDEVIDAKLNSKFQLSITQRGKPTFIQHKHLQFDTEILFDQVSNLLSINPTEIQLENSFFGIEGKIDIAHEMDLDLKLHGDKPNFNLFIALAPNELIKVFEQYENRGKLFFNASIKGKTLNGQMPAIRADFGCKDAFFSNELTHKKVDGIRFKGYFTTGEKRTMETMEFGISDFSARPETGKFTGLIKVSNFNAPNVDMKLISDFKLDFLAKFINSQELTGLKGNVQLTMKFKDIIDLNHPEKSIEKLNEAYESKLVVKNLSFNSNKLPYKIHNIDVMAHMDGHLAKIDHFNMRAGRSDVSISGHISDLPAIIHHSNIPVTTKLNVVAKRLDIGELSKTDASSKPAADEEVTNLHAQFKFITSAKAITESPTLPIGEFYIDDLYAKLKHYPHVLHDFHADVIIREDNFKVVDFTGQIDQSDFHFNGGITNYNLWFEDKLNGNTTLDFQLNSNKLKLEDLLVYKGENFIPTDYRHEELDQLKFHGNVALHFNHGLQSTDLQLDHFAAKMKVHPLRIDRLDGRFHLENEHLIVQQMDAKIGNSDVHLDLNYYLGKNQELKKRDNLIHVTSNRLDIDQLVNYSEQAPKTTEATSASPKTDHDNVFSIYDVPFPEMEFSLTVNDLKYHKYHITKLNTQFHTKSNHYVSFSKCDLHAAGGEIGMTGYFTATDKKHIYLRPHLKIKNIQLDQLLLKFDNFGQDHVVAENLHGNLSGTLSGKIHMHADMTPKLDDSEIDLSIEVLKGRLENYAPMKSLADYFQDKNLAKIHFDSLQNNLKMKNGELTVPKMGINTSLGYLELSGKQDAKMNMEYFVSVPLKMVTDAGFKKLFKKKREEVSEDQEDAIQYRTDKMRFVTVKIAGKSTDFSVSLSKQKKHKTR